MSHMKGLPTFAVVGVAAAYVALANSALAQDQPTSPYATISYAGDMAILHSQSRRCLSGALCTLSGQLGVPLSFEDAPIRFEGDYDDITSPAYRPRSDADHLRVPKGGPFSLAFPVISSNQLPSEVEALLNRIIEASLRTGFPGSYETRKIQGVWHVVPKAARDFDGAMRPVIPLTDTRISLPERPGRTNQAVFAEMFAQIKTKTGKEIFIASPLSHNYLEAENSRAAETTAREILERSFSAFGGHQLWILQCTPKVGPCALSIF
jgi:hypothetical protein